MPQDDPETTLNDFNELLRLSIVQWILTGANLLQVCFHEHAGVMKQNWQYCAGKAVDFREGTSKGVENFLQVPSDDVASAVYVHVVRPR